MDAGFRARRPPNQDALDSRRGIGSWIHRWASAAESVSGLLIGLSLGGVIGGLLIAFGSIFGSDASTWFIVVGWGSAAVAGGVAIPRALARRLTGGATNAEGRELPSGPRSATNQLPAWTQWLDSRIVVRLDRGDCTRLWLSLAGICLAAGLWVAVLPLFVALADRVQLWFFDHFVWAPWALNLLQLFVFLGACTAPLTLLGTAVAVQCRLVDIKGQHSAPGMGWVLLGVALGVALCSTLHRSSLPTNALLAAASVPLFVVTMLAVQTSKGTGRAGIHDQAAADRARCDSDSDKPQRPPWMAIVIPSCAAIAAVMWCRLLTVITDRGSIHGTMAASALLASAAAGMCWAGRRQAHTFAVGRPGAWDLSGRSLAVSAAGGFVAFRGLAALGNGVLTDSWERSAGWLVAGAAMLGTQFLLGCATGHALRVADDRSSRWSSGVLPGLVAVVLAIGLSLGVVVPLSLSGLGRGATALLPVLTLLGLAVAGRLWDRATSVRRRSVELALLGLLFAAMVGSLSPMKQIWDRYDRVESLAYHAPEVNYRP